MSCFSAWDELNLSRFPGNNTELQMSGLKVEVAIPQDLAIPDADKENLKKEFTAAMRGVLDKACSHPG
jgi:hypothetical protein